MLYYIDVYEIHDPYTKKFTRVEGESFVQLYLMFQYLGQMQERYKDRKESSFVIVSAKGLESRKQTLDLVLEHLAYQPTKAEIN